MLQVRFVKEEEFWYRYMEIIQTEAGTQFSSKDFQEDIFLRGDLAGL